MNTTSRSFFHGRAFALLLAVAAFTACGDELTSYKQTVRSGLAVLPWPKEMEALFGEGDHFVTHYGFSSGEKEWDTEIFFGGRYELNMQVAVEIDYKNHAIVRYTSPPRFSLAEIDSIGHEKNGAESANYSGQWFFDEAKWKKLVEAKGDWSAIGLPVKKNSPVPGFDAFVRASRASRVQVR
jgi:hypothetical protein